MARRSDHTRPQLTELALDAARKIVVDEGIAGLSARKVATKIGYTVGTLYQIFDDMDDLVERLNAATLAALHDHCAAGVKQGGVEDQLKALGVLFDGYARAHAAEWDAVMSYRFKDGHETADFYHTQILKLFSLMEAATRELYGPDEKEEHAADLAMLWASLTGILAVANSERKVGGSLDQMLGRLVSMYVKARQLR